jgi:Spy/CpxP family protein refolding chaperone
MKSSHMTTPLLLALVLGTASVACNKGSSGGSGGENATPGPSSSASAATPSASASAAPATSSSAAATETGDAASNAENAKEDEQEQEVVDELQQHHRLHHQGFAGFIISSIETLGISPDQQSAIEPVRKEFRTKMKALREANVVTLQVLADGIATGTIDKAKVDADVAKSAPAAAAVQAAIPNILDKLHAALRPEQRVALVDKIDAHWATWREVNAAEPTEKDKADKRFKHLEKELGMTSDQMDKFRANLEASKEAKKPFDAAGPEAYIKAFDTAFVADTFDAKKLPSPESAKLISFGGERMVMFYEALTPVLTPDQRAKLAERIRQHISNIESKEKGEKGEK